MNAPDKKRGRAKTRPPGKTMKQREDQLIDLAASLAEKQLAEGTASSQVITHFLRLGTTKALLEKEKLTQENLLLSAKTEALQSTQRVEELYKKALNAMREYSGQMHIVSEDDLDD